MIRLIGAPPYAPAGAKSGQGEIKNDGFKLLVLLIGGRDSSAWLFSVRDQAGRIVTWQDQIPRQQFLAE